MCSSRKGAGCQRGRKLAVNEGGSWLSTREGAVCQQGREPFIIEGGSHSSKKDTICGQGREDAVPQWREGTVC